MLDCMNDNRFNPEKIKITIFGETGTIQQLYDKARKDANGNVAGKDKLPDHIMVGGKKFASNMLGVLFESLWLCYLQNTPELIPVVRNADGFYDEHEKTAYNSSERVLTLVKEGGIAALNNDCKDFVLSIHKNLVNNPAKTYEALKTEGFKIAKKCFNEEVKAEDSAFAPFGEDKETVKKICEVYLSNLRNEITKEYGSGMLKKIEKAYMEAHEE